MQGHIFILHATRPFMLPLILILRYRKCQPCSLKQFQLKQFKQCNTFILVAVDISRDKCYANYEIMNRSDFLINYVHIFKKIEIS